MGALIGIVNTVSDVPERWSQASVYPDMWADPDEDPRNSDACPCWVCSAISPRWSVLTKYPAYSNRYTLFVAASTQFPS